MVVTRPLPRARELAERLEAAGLRALLLPALEIAPPPDPDPLLQRAAAARAGGYDWIVFTSANAVVALADALERSAGDPTLAPADRRVASAAGRAIPPIGAPTLPCRIAAVGSATARAVRRAGWSVDLMPRTFTAESLVAAFEDRSARATRVLFPAAASARTTVPRGLAALGAEVDTVVAYRTVLARGPGAPTSRRLRDEGVDLLTFTSPSAATGFLEAAGEDALRVPAAVIGPVTADAADGLGYRVVAVAEPHTADGLVEAAVRWLRSRSGSSARRSGP